MENISKFRPIAFEEGFYSIPDVVKKISDSFSISFEGAPGKASRKTIYTRLWRELESMELTDPRYVRKVSTRKTEYSHRIWNSILNKLYPWLCEMATNMEYREFEKWKERAKDYGRRYEKIMANADQISTMEQSSSFSVANAVEVEFRRRKLEIALDFIFSHYITIDESLLRANIERNLCYEKKIANADQISTMEQSSSSNVANDVEAEFQRRRLEIALDFIFFHWIELDESLLRADIENDFCLDEAAPSAYDLLVNERLKNNENYYTIKELENN